MRNVLPVPAQSNLIDYQKLVDKLNLIYSGSISGTYSPPQNNTNIQFCLAKQDVFGNVYATTQHLTSLATIDPTEIDQIKTIATASQSLLTFPRTKYINIYLVDAIVAHNAFAYLPSAHGLDVDGIYFTRELLATTNTDNDLVLNQNITALAHEMGHYLGLFHTFGICDPVALIAGTPISVTCSCANADPFSDGDKVQDTQPMELHNQSCDLAVSSCGNSTSNPDFKHNYMDYVSYNCRYYFSAGQIARMQFMLDPTFGARKSLLSGASACSNCVAMNGYQPVITPITNTVFQLNQLESTTFTANFLNGTTAFTPTPSYTWSLQFLDSVVTPITSTNTTFSLNSSLSVGNYSLTLKADVGNGCFKTTTFLFSIVPNVSSDACVTLPDPTSAAGWGAWNRVYYKGGWSRATGAANSGYSYSTTVRTPIQSTTGDLGFEILNLADLATNDPNFNNITSPPPVSKIMRVGRKITGLPNLEDGAAYYVNFTFHPTPANCKYRIWYLGMSNITAGYSLPNNIVYQSFNTNQSGETSFGILSRCQFNSPVISNALTDLGMNENGYLIDNSNGGGGFINRTAKLYGLNDMVFNKIHSPLIGNNIDYDNVSLGATNYVRTKVWKYYDLDFSEFVDTPGQGSNMNTQVTLTLFARTNDAASALSHSYAYYGIECKGGGMPADITMDLPNIQLSCQAPATSNCAYTINLPRPKYVLDKPDNGKSYFAWINPIPTNTGSYTNLASLTVAFSVASPLTGAPGIFSPINADFNTYVNSIQTDDHYTNYQLKLCNNETPNASIYYKVTLKTLHKTLESIFRVTNGYKTNSPPCPERLGTIPSQSVIRYVCSNDPQFALEYNTTSFCSDELVILGTPKFKWKMKTCTDATCTSFTEDTEIPSAVGPILNVNPLNLTSCVTLFTRYTEYNDLFCGKSYFPEQTFTVYNTTSFNAGSFTPNTYDICINGLVKVDVKGFKLSLPNCSLPTAISPIGSYVKFDLVAANNDTAPSYLPSVTTSLASSPKTVNYDALTYDSQPDFTLFFSNINAGVNIFPTNGKKIIYLKITYHILGCTKIDFTPVIFHIVNSSEPGAIKVSGETCSTFSIANADPTPTLLNPSGVTNPTGTYGWEYATATGPFNQLPAIPGNPTPPAGMTLINYPFNLLTGSLPFSIRRVSYGLDSCSNPNSYTVPVTVTNVPNFATALSYCSGVTALPTAPQNGVTGNWSPTFVGTVAATTTTQYTFTVDGGCTPPITQQVAVTINFTPKPTVPMTGNSPTTQTVCNGSTIVELAIILNLSTATLKWYKNPGGPTDFTTGNPGGLITPAFMGQTAAPYFIYVAQIINGCVGTRIKIPLTITTTPPPTASTQSLCAGTTVASLVATGTGIIKWYSALTGDNFLEATKPLATGTYYASQTMNGCESTRTQVAVTVNTLIAVNDNFSTTPINGSLGGATSTSVFANDTVNGLPILNSNVIVAISSINPPTSNISINSGGIIVVVANTPASTYVVNYSISQNGCTSTATATLSIIIIPASITCDLCTFGDYVCYQTTPQTTTRSFYNGEGYHGWQEGQNSIIGPRVNGIFPTLSMAIINVSPNTPLPWWLTLNSNGTFNVAASAPVGGCHLLVKFCTIGSIINCTPYFDVYLSVGGISLNTFGYNLNHEGTTNCSPGPSLCPVNLLDGGYFCGSPLPNSSLVTITQQAPFYPGALMINPLGYIVAQGYAPTGTYTFNYQVCLEADPSVCSNATSVFYVVDNLRMANPNAFKETNTFDVIVAPNPSEGLFSLSFDKVLKENVILEVYNPVGQKVYVATIANVKEHQLPLYNLPSGSYILKIAYKDEIISKRIIKK